MTTRPYAPPIDTRPTFTCPFTSSPISTRPGRGLVSPTAMSPLQPDCEALVFKKIPLPCSGASSTTYTSTDSEAAPSSDQCLAGPSSGLISRSPSLLTSLFMSNCRSGSSSRQTSSSGSSQPTPITPVSRSPSRACKPILRRDTSVSTSTSPNEDIQTPWRPLSSLQETTSDSCGLVSKRSCLKFAMSKHWEMAPAPTAVTGQAEPRGRSRICRSPAAVPAWADIPCALPDEVEDESDDEGYVEDGEDGFDSDEDEDDEECRGGMYSNVNSWTGQRWHSRFGTFGGSFRHSPRLVHGRDIMAVGSDESDADLEVFRRYSRSPSPVRRRHPADLTGDEEEEAGEGEDDPDATAFARVSVRYTEPPHPVRRVSINVACLDRCSRHVSPPPAPFGSSYNALGLDYAPPAASSPSALGFCRKRDARASQRTCESTGPYHLSYRKGSCPDEVKAGILRCTPAAPLPVPTESDMPRRVSSPVGPTPSSSCGTRLDGRIVAARSLSCASTTSAKEGLQRALRQLELSRAA